MASRSIAVPEYEKAGRIVHTAGLEPGLQPVALLTGGTDRHYFYGLATALLSKGMHLDVIGSDDVDGPEMHSTPMVTFLNLRGSRNSRASLPSKVSRIATYYARLIGYAWSAKPAVFHILWNNKFQFFDRTLLMLYYKVRGKKVVFTAHNINGARRDGHDSFINRLSLRIQYRLSDHIFVHTEKMKKELLKEFGVSDHKVTVIPFGINNAIPETTLTPAEAKERLGISASEKTMLFFGNIRPSKGLEYLLAAFESMVRRDASYRLIIAGRCSKQFAGEWEKVRPAARRLSSQGLVILRNKFIPDDETELYFKAADVLVLPYTDIFQSGVLFMGYNFGLPAVATDVGSLREDIVEGRTGFVCRPRDAADLSRALEAYFHSDLFANLNTRRREIRQYVSKQHSWELVAEMTRKVYAGLAQQKPV